ncbi:expressed unknown protein [Seminavis robusta]|uniref:Uncharacterized protein n=1 Tax=Seminavis robusta TaxID=568900 RepID=A0A9N8EKS0_9STRA|nr:expressed unknown protein [Seminavis robusta]|eukprot:Sro1354_g265420.1 n/a (204) ;mRNA; r:12071-12682
MKTKCVPTPVVRIVKCDCGKFEAKAENESFQSVICHCHGCVASKRLMIKNPDCFEGVPLSLYLAKNVEFLTDVKAPETSSKFGFVKVGEHGKLPRIYCKSCNSHVMNLPVKGVVAFNRYCMYEADGITKYNPEGLLNVNAKHSFDPSKVPEPKHDTFGPIGSVLWEIAPSMIATKLPGAADISKDHKGLFPDPSTMEVAEITW